MRRPLRILGIAAALLGLVWIGQGSGWFPYPASSVMIDQTEWAWRGLGLLSAGVLALILSRR